MIDKIIVLVFLGLLGMSLAYRGDDLPKGPYCGRNGRCCNDRQDECSHPILDSLCYCDEFCNRTIGADDCCPDYEEVCLGIAPPPPPPDPEILTCKHGRNYYGPGEEVIKGCNKCVCRYPDLPEEGHWDCERDECLISEEVMRYVNRDYYMGWRATNYSEFSQRKLKDGLIYKLGTLPYSRATAQMLPLNLDKDISYPAKFDARDRWRDFISPITDQGWCGSDWAVAIAGVTSDRLAIQSNGAEKVQLSAQMLLSCTKHQQGCRGGEFDVAWNYIRMSGLVDEECFPYTASKTQCHFRRRGNLLTDGCRPAVRGRTSRYKVGPPAKLNKEHDIMYDIMRSGPVHAIMTVHQDFFHYRDGIYRRSKYGNNQLKGLHSVKIIGWGEENGQKYWIVANSWGTGWGENGYFRIARGENESGIESFVVTVQAFVTEAYRRK